RAQLHSNSEPEFDPPDSDVDSGSSLKAAVHLAASLPHLLHPPTVLHLSLRDTLPVGRWLMLTEELGQVHQAIAPVPLWFRYLVTYQESDGVPGLTLGVLLALLYLILKNTGSAATRAQCSEAGDVCPICQGEYREPRVLICQNLLTCFASSAVQHVFCDECIALWFNREKSCPLCRTVITDKVYKWRDGATSPHLQIY
ncbi:hypothetical protein GOODEAATRI_018787, partial [Goodea atripinnis]